MTAVTWKARLLIVLICALCFSRVTAQECSQHASVLLEASWSAQLGWESSTDVPRWKWRDVRLKYRGNLSVSSSALATLHLYPLQFLQGLSV